MFVGASLFSLLALEILFILRSPVHPVGSWSQAVNLTETDRRGCAFIALDDFTHFTRTPDATGAEILTSPELSLPLPANEIVVSWNADAPAETGLKIEARAFCGDHFTRYYTLGLWSKDAGKYPRESVKDQQDADGDVETDTLVMTHTASRLQLRITREPSASGVLPTLKFLGVSLLDTHAQPPAMEPNHAVWGKEVVVPGRSQLGYPDASGWCSPTSTAMVLAFWAQALHRPQLDLPVPDVAHVVYDRVWRGTGNWPFNTAFAGSFPDMRAYVTRFSDIRELEDWIEAGIPPVVSVSYALLLDVHRENDPGHLMVCDGFTSDGDIILNDPFTHLERGETVRKVFPRANFLRAWQRSKKTVYLIYPIGTKLPPDPLGHW